MPYEIETKDGIVLRGIPDDVAPDDPSVKQRVQAARTQARQQSPEYQAKVQAQQDADRELYDPTKGMSVGEKSLANIGAGMDNLIHGARQRYNEITGDEGTANALRQETAEKRKRDERLAESQTGGGALQFAGEVLPTLVIPGGSTIKGAAVVSALGGALQPTAEGESAALNAGVGAAFGGALAGAMKGAGKAYRALVPGNAQTRATQRVAQELGPDAAAQAATLRQALPQAAAAPPVPASGWMGRLGRTQPGVLPNTAAGPGGIPLSAAAHAGDDTLARLEQASRLRNPELWSGFTRAHGEGVANAVRGATAEADDIGSRVAQRGTDYRNARAAAMQAMDPDRFASELPNLRQHVADLLDSPDAVDSGVASALKETARILQNERVSPEHLAELRKNLSGRIVPGNILKSADRSNPAILRLTGTIDNMLDNLSGDAWRPVNEGFRAQSAGVEAGRAAQRVRDVFFDPLSGNARKTAVDALGEIPAVTEDALRKAMEHGFDKTRRTDLFSAPTREGLTNALDAVRAQNIIQRLNKTATAGGGSATATNMTALAQEEARQAALNRLGSIPTVGRLLRAGVETAGTLRNGRTDAALAEALQNPQAMAQLLGRIEKAQGPQAAVSLSRMLKEAARNTRNVTPGLTMDMRNTAPTADQ